MLDLFCGRWGWSKAFAARGWTCVGVDLVEPTEKLLENCFFQQGDVMDVRPEWVKNFNFACASPPCEQFSVWSMKHFHPHPKYPENGIKLFNHTREILEASGVPYVMENVRAAQQFVGNAVHHCGPFYLWGNAVPPLVNQGVKKGMNLGSTYILKSMTIEERRAKRKQYPMLRTSSGSAARKALTGEVAQIPPELANCVADYAERILEGAEAL